MKTPRELYYENLLRINDIIVNANPNHDKLGRFSKGSSGKTYKSYAGKSKEVQKVLDSYKGVKYNERDINALQKYRSLYFKGMNDYLRNGNLSNLPSNLSNYTVKEAKTDISNLNSAIKKATLKENTLLYRIGLIPKNVKLGSSFIEKGFSSTTLLGENSIPKAQGNVQMIIQAKKGQHIGVMNNYSQKKYKKNDKFAELVLPSGTKYKVISKKNDKYLLEIL